MRCKFKSPSGVIHSEIEVGPDFPDCPDYYVFKSKQPNSKCLKGYREECYTKNEVVCKTKNETRDEYICSRIPSQTCEQDPWVECLTSQKGVVAEHTS